MKKQFNHNTTQVKAGAIILLLCCFVFALVAWGNGTIVKSGSVLISLMILLGLFFTAGTRGVYAVIDTEKGVLYRSSFFIKKELPIKDITSIETKAILGGLLTEVRVHFQEHNKKSVLGGLSVEGFKENEFQVFLETLRDINPNIILPKS